MAGTPHSGIRDNHSRGTVGDFLRHHLRAGADLDLVTAYFTIFAYDKLRAELNHLGKSQPYVELCRLFDRQTEQGADMRTYSRLLGQAVESITATFQKRLASGLQGSRQFVLPTLDAQPREDSAFELVTWLVLLDGAAAIR